MAPDFERLARTPWPIASLASSGIRPLSSAFALSWSRKAEQGVDRNTLQRTPPPRIGSPHIDGADADGLHAWSGRLGTEEARGFAALNAAPELLLSGQQKVLVQAIGRDGDLDPFAAAGDDREHCRLGVGDPHVVLQLGHMLFGRPLFGERPRQHELGLKNRSSGLDDAVQGGGHPAHHWVMHAALNPRESLSGIAFVPKAVEGLGGEAKLDDKVARKVLRLDLRLRFSAARGGEGRLHHRP